MSVPTVPSALANNLVPSAPPLDKMDHLGGYESVTFNSAPLPPPPSYTECIPVRNRDLSDLISKTAISEEDAKDALLTSVSEHCCYGKSAARDMVVKDIQNSSAYHYTLESFTEKRSTAWTHEPYNGQFIDGPFNGPAPGPWDVSARYTKKFHNGKFDTEVPHTASVKPCHMCLGMGRKRCNTCFGDGRALCSLCTGNGFTALIRQNDDGTTVQADKQPCTQCNASGCAMCKKCSGNGHITCKCCKGFCQLKCYIKLKVTWTTHMGEYVEERTSLPKECIKSVTGVMALDEEQTRVAAVTNLNQASVVSASRRLVEEHSAAFPSERILLQRQRIRVVPVSDVWATFKQSDFNFQLYGMERKVQAPDYPQKYFWGCTLL